ncbi:anhydro-N-acetylmuramic acid kinase [Colwellia sp. 75C3]|uniref:anhydro-N-acetylmuramic acid kinase n=1 Tax=Colwellia sp. 75C3 TaxID=888425 RepID=UPI000C34E4BD|nr:anhydro-N-acetylmuramic acid kinase [Colwellia sp. 75C3]PKG81642.1 anhydro-N-acetylmuramic acid kinase [Colwellia sp. 75C3]
MQGKYYIGLMSGTSADGIDLALVDFTSKNEKPRLVASFYQSYSSVLAEKITSLYQPGNNEIDRAFHLDVELAHLFAQAINALLSQENLNSADIIAIGSHGQTIRHRPSADNPFTLQIGCCQTLATVTGIRVVGQFRRKDMALGGQGAPLVPIFHQQLFAHSVDANFVVNIGGIANITFLPEQGSSKSVLGFDTGPGNALLDDWFTKNHSSSNEKFDKSGAWAATGKVNQALLIQLMQDDYIKAAAPKSTGREYFHLDWLEQQLTFFTENSYSQHGAITDEELNAVDVQATLLVFTAQSICDAIKSLTTQGKVYLCGGGVHNSALVEALKTSLNTSNSAFEINSMQALNIDGDILEAMAFAWLAYAFDHSLVSNMPAVTGASASCTLGSTYLP